MTARISQILTVGLAIYSFLQVRASLIKNLPGGAAANAAKVLFGIQILMSVLFFLIPLFPQSVHFGSRRRFYWATNSESAGRTLNGFR